MGMPFFISFDSDFFIFYGIFILRFPLLFSSKRFGRYYLPFDDFFSYFSFCLTMICLHASLGFL